MTATKREWSWVHPPERPLSPSPEPPTGYAITWSADVLDESEPLTPAEVSHVF